MMEDFIGLPTDELLKRFGAGQHKPGSGSAAALGGLLSAALIHTVMALTAGHEGYDDTNLTAALEERVYEIEAQLRVDFQEDSFQFDKVIRARQARDAARSAGDERLADKKTREALNLQRTCTDVPLRMAKMCVELAETALLVFDFGFKSARGDSVVAISVAVAAATGCVGIVYLNIKDFRRPSDWSRTTMSATAEVEAQIEALQTELARRNATLRNAVPVDG
ncbi:cyclodeaminase/cyclohydrolase family protein [Cellulomonas sp. P5_C5]